MAEPPEQSTSLEASPAADGPAAEAVKVSPGAPGQAAAGGAETTGKGALPIVWTLFVRLLILGFGISLGWILGLLVAQIFPSRNPNPPFQEVVMRRTSQTWWKISQLPQWWRGDGGREPSPELTVAAEAPPPSVDAPPRLTLTPELQQQVEEELSLLQADLASLENRLADLEASLGEEDGAGAIETRLQQLDQLLSPPAPADEPATLSPPPLDADPEEDAQGEVYAEPPFPLVTDSIVLPSSLLFEPGGSLLTPGGKQLLNTVVPDLQRYPSATILVGSHTAGDDGAEAVRKLTFQQAIAVQQYLAEQLGDMGMHWVTLGYGQTRPRVAGDSPQAQQRNQRVEIGIVP